MTAGRTTTAGTSSANHLTPSAACPGWTPQRADYGQRVVCESCGREKWAHEVPVPRSGR